MTAKGLSALQVPDLTGSGDSLDAVFMGSRISGDIAYVESDGSRYVYVATAVAGDVKANNGDGAAGYWVLIGTGGGGGLITFQDGGAGDFNSGTLNEATSAFEIVDVGGTATFRGTSTQDRFILSTSGQDVRASEFIGWVEASGQSAVAAGTDGVADSFTTVWSRTYPGSVKTLTVASGNADLVLDPSQVIRFSLDSAVINEVWSLSFSSPASGVEAHDLRAGQSARLVLFTSSPAVQAGDGYVQWGEAAVPIPLTNFEDSNDMFYTHIRAESDAYELMLLRLNTLSQILSRIG